MPDDGFELRSIAWTRVFPFLRMFRAFRASLHHARLIPAFACVLACYLAGRGLDAIWGERGGVRHVRESQPIVPRNEIEAYAVLPASGFSTWVTNWNSHPGDAKLKRGPFISTLDYESHCFAAAIAGVAAGRFGFDGSAFSHEPSLCGSIASAASGVQWLALYRPLYALIYGLIHIAAFAFFGTAICRHAAIHSAREESVGLKNALVFACDKYMQSLLSPLILIAVAAGVGLLLIIGGIVSGLVSLIPYVGVVGFVLGGLLYPLALLLGVAIAFIIIALVTGLHLMLPTVAAEGSDAFDAMSRSTSYVFARPWKLAFYSLVLLIYGAFSFIFVRLCALLLLKVTHAFTSLGMSFFGYWRSAKSDTAGRLDALWKMPAWSDLPLLPPTGGAPFWGTFGNVPLSAGETLGMWLIAFWVFVVVGLVGAFIVSFYFSASTEMYFLLRREVDATDWEDVFYEAPEDGPMHDAPPAAAAPAESKGTPLPVVSGGAPNTSSSG